MEVYLASKSFFLTHHVIPNWFRDLTRFFSKSFWLFFFFITSLFLLFHKNYYHFTKGKEPARSPKPAVSFPLNPFHLGHGFGFYPKNPPTSGKKVSSVSYEQIRVAIFFYHTMSSWTLRFFVRTCFEEWFRISFYFKKFLIFLLFLFLLCFYFFIKIITTPLRGRNQLGVRSPLFWIWVIHSDYIFPYDSGSLLPSSPRRSGVMLAHYVG